MTSIENTDRGPVAPRPVHPHDDALQIARGVLQRVPPLPTEDRLLDTPDQKKADRFCRKHGWTPPDDETLIVLFHNGVLTDKAVYGFKGKEKTAHLLFGGTSSFSFGLTPERLTVLRVRSTEEGKPVSVYIPDLVKELICELDVNARGQPTYFASATQARIHDRDTSLACVTALLSGSSVEETAAMLHDKHDLPEYVANRMVAELADLIRSSRPGGLVRAALGSVAVVAGGIRLFLMVTRQESSRGLVVSLLLVSFGALFAWEGIAKTMNPKLSPEGIVDKWVAGVKPLPQAK